MPTWSGRHVAAYVIGGLILLAAVTVVLSLAFAADGARHPVTWASVVVAVVVVLGRPAGAGRGCAVPRRVGA